MTGQKFLITKEKAHPQTDAQLLEGQWSDQATLFCPLLYSWEEIRVVHKDSQLVRYLYLLSWFLTLGANSFTHEIYFLSCNMDKLLQRLKEALHEKIQKCLVYDTQLTIIETELNNNKKAHELCYHHSKIIIFSLFLLCIIQPSFWWENQALWNSLKQKKTNIK